VNRHPIAPALTLIIALLSVVAPGPSRAQAGADLKTLRGADMARINEQLERELKEKEEAQARRAKEEAERAARLLAITQAGAKPAARTQAANGQAQADPAAPAALAPLRPEQRLALVIGNSGYKTGPLTNPVNDARAMAVRLQQLGFSVVKKENASREEMMAAVRDFGAPLANGGVGLFYYAGHGVQSKGANYLVPVDADIRNEDELSTRAYNANEVLEKMDSAKNRINVVILDACRDNPFARSFRSGSRGLAGMDQAPSGTLVAYATSPGSTASDGLGANGLYTEQLLQAMNEPGVKLEEVFKRVRVGVKERSEGKQLPWEMSSVTGDFYFNPTPDQAAEMAAAAVAYASRQGAGAAPVAAVATAGRSTSMPVLISRKLIEQYQMNASAPLAGDTRMATFSPNGAYFLLANGDRQLRLWHADTGLAVPGLPRLNAPIATAHGESLAGINAEGEAVLRDLDNAEQHRLLDKLPKGSQGLILSPDGQRVLVLHRDKGLLLFKRDTQDQVAELDSVSGDLQYAFSPDGKRLIAWGDRDSNMKLYDTETGKRIERLSAHWDPPSVLRFSQDGKSFVSVAAKDKAIVWRTIDGEVMGKFELGKGGPMAKEVELLNEGRHLLVYAPPDATLPGAAPELSLWDVKSGARVATLLPASVPLKSYRVVAERHRLFVNGGEDLRVYDLKTLQRTHQLAGMELVDLSDDARRLLVRNGDEIRLMDADSLTVVARLRGQVSAFAAAKGKLFATSTGDGLLTLWNFDTAEQVGQLKGHLDTVKKVVFSDDGRRLASLGADNTVKLWALPEVKDRQVIVKNQLESTAEYVKRVANWNSPYTTLVTLDAYDADSALFNVRFGELSAAIPLDREAAKKLVGQRQAVLSARLKFFDSEQLVIADAKLSSVASSAPE
jgi:WD40 repeat protein